MLPEELVELNDICSHILHDTVFQKGTEAQLERLIDDLHVTGSGHGLRLGRRTAALHQCTSNFEIGHFIRPLSVIGALLDTRSVDDLEAAPWRPDDILFKANLAHLARRVLHIDEDTGIKLQKLDCEWPRPFLSALAADQGPLVPGHSRLVEETIEVALAIRSQLAVHMLRAQHGMPGMTPLDIVDQVFRLGIDQQSDVNNFSFERVTSTGLGFEAVSEDIRARIATNARRHIDFFGRFITDDGEFRASSVKREGVDFDGLKAAYPLLTFQLTLIQWIRKRCQELDDSITAYGGAYVIKNALEEEINARAKERRVRSSLPKFVAGSSASMRLLAARRKRLSDKVRGSVMTGLEQDPISNNAENAEFAGTSLFVPEFEQPMHIEDRSDDHNELLIEELERSQQSLRKNLETRARDTMVQNTTEREIGSKRQKLIDRQAAATRIAPIDESQEVSHDADGVIMVEDDNDVPYDSGERMHQPLQRVRSSPGRVSPAVRQQPITLDGDTLQRSTGHVTEAGIDTPEPDGEHVDFETGTRDGRAERRAHARDIAAQSSLGISRHPVLVNQFPRHTAQTHGAHSDATIEVEDGVEQVRDPPDEDGDYQPPASQKRQSARPETIPQSFFQADPPSSNYCTVNEEAKTSRRVQDAERRKVRKRRPWKREETDALIDYIGSIGPHWSLIKLIDSGLLPKSKKREEMAALPENMPYYKALLERDQGSLKDKARNMKVDYLR